MNEADFRDYIGCYQSRDYAQLEDLWYAPDVIYDGFGHAEGVQAVLGYYREVLHRDNDETYEIRQVAVGGDAIGAELVGTRTYTADFESPLGPVTAGQRVRFTLLLMYTLRGGRISHVKAARFAVEQLASAS